MPPRTLANWRGEWLGTYPGKVLYGADGHPFNASFDLPPFTWIANGKALALALTGMLRDGEILCEQPRIGRKALWFALISLCKDHPMPAT